MGFMKSLAKNLPELVVDLIPGGSVVKTIARTITGAMDDDEAERRLAENPGLRVELEKAVLIHIVEMAKAENDRIQAENEALAEVNRTMRMESNSDSWWQSAWRPFWGFVSALAFALMTGYLCWLGYRAILGQQPEALAMVPQLITSFAPLWAVPAAILGVASWHRGKEKRIKAGELPLLEGPVKGLVKNAVGLVKRGFRS